MNILITYLSLYGNPAKRSYHTNGLCSESEIEASQTNEPVLRLLEKNLEEKGQRIEKIIPVLSFKAENENLRVFQGADSGGRWNSRYSFPRKRIFRRENSQRNGCRDKRDMRLYNSR